jgi:hypothetical protein
MIIIYSLLAIAILSWAIWRIRIHKLNKLARPVAYLKRYEEMDGENLSDQEVEALNLAVQTEWQDAEKRKEMVRQASFYIDSDPEHVISIAITSGYKIS